MTKATNNENTGHRSDGIGNEIIGQETHSIQDDSSNHEKADLQ